LAEIGAQVNTRPDPLLRTHSVTKAFAGLVALQDVCLDIHPGEILGIIGPNGAGKTTLFNVLTGTLPVTSGRIEFCERDITGLGTHRIARLGMTRTFQNIQLFTRMTALENVLVGRHLQGSAGLVSGVLRLPAQRKEEARLRRHALLYLERVGLADRQHDLAGILTTGQQRLLEVARALAAEPRLILLDEPAAGLNTKETETLAEFIQRMPGELRTTVALIEHDMRLVMQVSDRVVVIDQGSKLADDAPAAVQRNPEVIAAYLGDDFLEHERERAASRGGQVP
jgi:ABC-type branched-subunit amino acid transport system ATPase component